MSRATARRHVGDGPNFISGAQPGALAAADGGAGGPLVEYGTSNLTDDGKPRLSLELSNSGVGPTRVRSVRRTYRGRVLTAGKTVPFLVVPPDTA